MVKNHRMEADKIVDPMLIMDVGLYIIVVADRASQLQKVKEYSPNVYFVRLYFFKSLEVNKWRCFNSLCVAGKSGICFVTMDLGSSTVAVLSGVAISLMNISSSPYCRLREWEKPLLLKNRCFL